MLAVCIQWYVTSLCVLLVLFGPVGLAACTAWSCGPAACTVWSCGPSSLYCLVLWPFYCYFFKFNFLGPGVKPLQDRNMEYLEDVAIQTARFVRYPCCLLWAPLNTLTSSVVWHLGPYPALLVTTSGPTFAGSSFTLPQIRNT